MSLPTIPLKIYRGDTYSSYWKIKRPDGTYYTLKDNDKIIFGVKRSTVDKEPYLWQKVYSGKDAIDGGFAFSLSSQETQQFKPADYVYDIGVQIASSQGGEDQFYHIIQASPFTIIPTVTSEVEE